MTFRLERLVYQSTATGSTGSLLNIATILAESQRNNDARGLTGALAAHNEQYIQVIEGLPHVLDGLLRRLQGDGRHRNIVILDRQPIPARSFGGWSMASARITPEQAPALDALMAGDREAVDEVVAAMVAALVLDGSTRA